MERYIGNRNLEDSICFHCPSVDLLFRFRPDLIFIQLEIAACPQTQEGDSLLLGDGLHTFWVGERLSSIPMGYAIWGKISIIFGLLMRKFDIVSAKQSFFTKCCNAVAKKLSSFWFLFTMK